MLKASSHERARLGEISLKEATNFRIFDAIMDSFFEILFAGNCLDNP